jgi:predicted nucleic-acid-binding Zn-ribbon protein
MKRPAVYNVDLTKIEGAGDFPCPKCGATISPEDETEAVYTILETKMKKESLEELIIQCNRCGTEIRLVGFLSQSDGIQPETTST